MTRSLRSLAAADEPCRRYYLIYLVLDASLSMRLHLRTGRPNPDGSLRHTHLGQFTDLIPRMLRILSEHPVVNTLASISVVGFNDVVQVLRPMSTLGRPSAIAAPPEGDATDYAAVLRFLGRQYHRDVRSVHRERHRPNERVVTASPWIYFITDGRPYTGRRRQPPEEWLPHRDALVEGEAGARLVALGLHGASREPLWRLATGTGDGVRNAFIASPDADPGSLADSIVSAIGDSISDSMTSDSAETLLIDIPDGMERIIWRGRG